MQDSFDTNSIIRTCSLMELVRMGLTEAVVPLAAGAARADAGDAGGVLTLVLDSRERVTNSAPRKMVRAATIVV